MNIKRGLKRLWVVVSVLWVIYTLVCITNHTSIIFIGKVGPEWHRYVFFYVVTLGSFWGLWGLLYIYFFWNIVIQDGLETSWYKNGKKKLSQCYKNGHLEGMKTEWYPSGKNKSTSHYKNGIENGLRKEWDENGKLTFQGNFVDGNEEIK